MVSVCDEVHIAVGRGATVMLTLPVAVLEQLLPSLTLDKLKEYVPLVVGIKT